MNLELLKVCCTLVCSIQKVNSAAFQYSDFYCLKCFTFQFRERDEKCRGENLIKMILLGGRAAF